MSLKLEISTIVPCVNNCFYCAQGNLKRAYTHEKKKMTFEDFKTLMSKVPSNVKIEFAGFSESFANKESSLMMRWCVENGYVTDLYTTLVGFSENDAQILRGLTFNMVSFHEFDGYNKEKFEKSKRLFRENIFIKTLRTAKFSNNQGTYSRAGQTRDVSTKLGAFNCGSTLNFDHNVLLPNGDVSLCCMDYSLKHIIGNLYETDYMSLNRQQIKNLSDMRESDIICRKCEVMVERYTLSKFIKKWKI